MTWSSHADRPTSLDDVMRDMGAALLGRLRPADAQPEPCWTRAPADFRVRWHRPTRFWFIDRLTAGEYITVKGTPAFRDQSAAMTRARGLARRAAAWEQGERLSATARSTREEVPC